MLVRVAIVSACALGVGILRAGWAAAEDLAPEQTRAFVVAAWGAFFPMAPW